MEKFLLGERLTDIRKEHNIRQEDLARVLGIDRTAYNAYEKNRSRISVEKLCMLADIYNVSIDWILGRTEKEATKIKIASIANKVDPIAMLNHDEQLLLMLYRLAADEEKDNMLNAISVSGNDESEENA